MTFKELKGKIKTLSEEKQTELNDLEVTIHYKHLSFDKNLKGFVDIYSFVKKQFQGWEKVEEIPNYLEKSKEHFTEIYKKFKSYIDNLFSNEVNLWQIRSFPHDVLFTLRKPRLDIKYTDANYRTTRSSVAVFTYDAPETVFLLSLFSKSPNSFQAATTFIAEESYQIADLDHSYKVSINYNQFYGMQQAYEFRLQENERVRRSELEKKSLEELRDSFHEYAEKAEETLQELIQKNNASLQKAANKIDTLAAEKARAFVNMQKQSDTNYQHWLENTKR